MQRRRDASDRVAEGEPAQVDAAVLADFRDVFAARRRTFRLKLTSKPALSAVSALGAVGALFLGGWSCGAAATWARWWPASAARGPSGPPRAVFERVGTPTPTLPRSAGEGERFAPPPSLAAGGGLIAARSSGVGAPSRRTRNVL